MVQHVRPDPVAASMFAISPVRGGRFRRNHSTIDVPRMMVPGLVQGTPLPSPMLSGTDFTDGKRYGGSSIIERQHVAAEDALLEQPGRRHGGDAAEQVQPEHHQPLRSRPAPSLRGVDQQAISRM